MNEINNTSYGKRMSYDPLWKGPMEQKRTPTNFRFFIAFLIYIFFWVILQKYGPVYSEDISPNNDTNRNFPLANFDTGTSTSPSIVEHGDYIHGWKLWGIVIASLSVAPLLSIIFVLLLRPFAKPMIYTTTAILCVLLFCVSCTIAFRLSDKYDYTPKSLSVMVLCTATLIGLIVFCVYYWRDVGLACEIIRESSTAIWFFPSLLLYPLITFSIDILILFSGLTTTYDLWNLAALKNHDSLFIILLLSLNIFGMIWLREFIKALSQTILAGIIATWYWSMDKRYVPSNTITKSISSAFRYHLGTVAFGSMITFICLGLRCLLKAISYILEFTILLFNSNTFNWYDNLFGVFGRFVCWVDRSAFIMCAVHGTDFLKSGKDSYGLLMRNLSKVFMVLESLIFTIFVGQLFSLAVSLTIFSGGTYIYQGTFLEYEVWWIVVIGVLWGVDDLFSVLRVASETVFYCILEDYERNDGSAAKPYYMSFKLKSLLIRDEI